MARIFIGTSGWSYEHWSGIFYPPDLGKSKWLQFYAQHFETVEINASFYHLPKKKTFENWRQIGKKFVFSVKGSRFITHIKRLKDCQEPIKRFFEAAEGLGKGLVLWQLPPSMKADPVRLKDFLDLLPEKWRSAFEFRNESWLEKRVFQLLSRYRAAIVFQDFPFWPRTEVITTDFVYLRFHGQKELYASCYSPKKLESWAKKMQNWQKEGLDIHAYFNNDMRGFAVKNAQELIKLAAPS